MSRGSPHNLPRRESHARNTWPSNPARVLVIGVGETGARVVEATEVRLTSAERRYAFVSRDVLAVRPMMLLEEIERANSRLRDLPSAGRFRDRACLLPSHSMLERGGFLSPSRFASVLCFWAGPGTDGGERRHQGDGAQEKAGRMHGAEKWEPGATEGTRWTLAEGVSFGRKKRHVAVGIIGPVNCSEGALSSVVAHMLSKAASPKGKQVGGTDSAPEEKERSLAIPVCNSEHETEQRHERYHGCLSCADRSRTTALEQTKTRDSVLTRGHTHQLDRRGRVTTPKRWRSMLGCAYSTGGWHGCPFLFPWQYWEEIARQLREVCRAGGDDHADEHNMMVPARNTHSTGRPSSSGVIGGGPNCLETSVEDRRESRWEGARPQAPRMGHADKHDPVMVREVLEYLACRLAQVIVDATVGSGGHAEAILEQVRPSRRLIGIDRDLEALERPGVRLARHGRLDLVNENHARLEVIFEELGIDAVDGVLIDCGVSLEQLTAARRGISFRLDGPLDMRMDPRQETTAADLVNRLPEEELARILQEYGGERRARAIAQAIVAARQQQPITTTGQLAAIVTAAITPRARPRRLHAATKTFMALRVAVNDELGALHAALTAAVRRTRPGGRIVVLTYQSGEGGETKGAFRQASERSRCLPSDFCPLGGGTTCNPIRAPALRCCVRWRSAEEPGISGMIASPELATSRAQAWWIPA